MTAKTLVDGEVVRKVVVGHLFIFVKKKIKNKKPHRM